MSTSKHFSKSFTDSNGNDINVSIEPYSLTLRTAFGTSHSSTTQRLNGLITISFLGKSGYGECAMPPKKPGIYLADYDDCFRFVEAFAKAASTTNNKFVSYEPFSTTPLLSSINMDSIISGLNADNDKNGVAIIRALFGVMDTIEESSLKESRVARNAIEMALIDLLGKFTHKPSYTFLLGEQKTKEQLEKPSYYTVGINVDTDEMVRSAHFGLSHTPYLKLKMDRNVPFWSSWLPKLKEICAEKTMNFKWSIDANADWSPEVATQMIPILSPYKDVITMVEQPFPVHMSEAEMSEWTRIKDLYEQNGFVIYADESVSTSEDVEHLKRVAHGVNIKLDKTGGVREALRTYSKAVEAGLGIWIGIMVSSRLSTTMASCILPLSTLGGDLDGQLLVDEESDKFMNGIVWDTKTGLVSPPTEEGLGLTKKA